MFKAKVNAHREHCDYLLLSFKSQQSNHIRNLSNFGMEATYVWTGQLCSPTQSTFQIDPLSSVAHILERKIWLATWLTEQRENSLWTSLLLWV